VILGIVSTLLNILFLTPLSYSIAWYEKFGTSHNRTLLNQLVSSMCWIQIVQNCTVLPLEIILNFFGPFALSYCTVFQLYKNTLFLDTFILTTFITIVKYVFIFILKNPSGAHSEFWCLFINMLSGGFSFLAQATYLFLPEKQPTIIYICAGINPNSIQSQNTKSNYVFIVVFCFSIFSYSYTFIKKKILNSAQSPSNGLQNQFKAGWTLPPISHGLDTLTLANFGTILLFIFFVFPASFAYGQINNMPFEKLMSFPYYFLVHFIMHGAPLLQHLCFSLVFLSKSKNMRTVLLREMLDKLK
jgi:hypothetical protein